MQEFEILKDDIELLPRPARSGWAEAFSWFYHNSAHELRPNSDEHIAFYQAFADFRARRDSALFGIDLEDARVIVPILINEVQLHDFIEASGQDKDIALWEKTLDGLERYFFAIDTLRGIPDRQIAHLTAKLELGRWVSHRRKNYPKFAELTTRQYELLFRLPENSLPSEVGETFARAANIHDISEGNDEAAIWAQTAQELEEHYLILFRELNGKS